VKTSSRHVRIHIHVRRGSHLRSVKISVNGKHLKTLTGKAAKSNITLVNLPCSSSGTVVKITVTLSNGKTVTESHHYTLCSA
jgi:tmRNA-binding protein